MPGTPKPKPCFLDEQDKFGVRGGKQIWLSNDRARYFTWDSLHGEIEVFNKRGWHLGSLDAETGQYIKQPVKGRKINV
ncbi:MAG: hypothetical protein K8F52_09650 [Candidatus Scalindua rubra]|nr:hypothetical protein [Candidatus Scalindua rubra]